MRKSFPSFGGVMLWDASQAYANSRYDLGIKNALVAAGATGFTYPACSAPAYVSGTDYSGGAQVSYGGYIWQAKWYASSTPANNPNGDWSASKLCLKLVLVYATKAFLISQCMWRKWITYNYQQAYDH
ncbi:hypothetical protein HWV62_42675 [Athelia sp. TMB]|nr:hypothetical protein HWV62_42675 [Athelia sp. TMB]